jgi:hypothetical protein
MDMDADNIRDASTEELEKMMQAIQDELARRKGEEEAPVTVEYSVSYHQYKGSGKAWIAELDPKTKARVRFLNPEYSRKGEHEVTKYFRLTPGMYEANSYLSRHHDQRVIFTVDEDGEIEYISKKDVPAHAIRRSSSASA